MRRGAWIACCLALGACLAGSARAAGGGKLLFGFERGGFRGHKPIFTRGARLTLVRKRQEWARMGL